MSSARTGAVKSAFQSFGKAMPRDLFKYFAKPSSRPRHNVCKNGWSTFGNIRIRLHGIDAPEAKQTCTADGNAWRCGWEANNALANIVGEHWVTCRQRDKDRYGRIVAVCRAGPVDLNAWMVGEGWAVAYRRFSMDYARDESEAKGARRGLWRGEFAMPWNWRRSRRRNDR